jgi:hypothetical protein
LLDFGIAQCAVVDARLVYRTGEVLRVAALAPEIRVSEIGRRRGKYVGDRCDLAAEQVSIDE